MPVTPAPIHAARAFPAAPDGPRREAFVPDPPSLHSAVLGWFEEHGRRLAFRASRDPYAILVAEVMLQQTQASRGEPAWRAFLERFPTWQALAAASPAEVLRSWAGLGYNRRALNLQRTARVVVERYGARLPADLATLQTLPGVGPYTARAVAAAAFGYPCGPVDTNVRRVLGRLMVGHGARRDAGVALPTAELQAFADGLAPADRPAAWTAALMDIGATLCRPARPACPSCPLRTWCRYASEGRAAAKEAAATDGAARAGGRSPAVSFEQTNRWLRGRIVDRLRDLPDGTWYRLETPIGSHGPDAVTRAVAALAAEGLLEQDAAGRVRLPR